MLTMRRALHSCASAAAPAAATAAATAAAAAAAASAAPSATASSSAAEAARLARRIRALQPLLNAFVSPFDAEGMQAPPAATAATGNAATAAAAPSPSAAAAAAASAAASPSFPLAARGLSVSLKDNFCMAGTRTTAGSRMLSSFVPHYDSHVAARLKQAGARITGKTNMDEFGMGSFNASSHSGRVINPYSFRNCRTAADIKAVLADEGQLLSAGGSSGGSAAALAADTCDGSIGSDTGGSIRLPASYCGVLGLKPTYGRVSRFGLISYASSMDTPSIMAKSTRNLRTIMNTIEGFDPRDSTSIDHLPPTAASSPFDELDGGGGSGLRAGKRMLEGLTVGIPSEYNIAELTPAVRSAWHRVAALLRDEGGARVVTVSLPSTRHALPAYYILAPAEAMSNLSRYDGVRYGHAQSKALAEEAAAAAAAVGLAAPSRGGADAGPPAQSLRDYYTANRSAAFGAEVQRRILVGSFVLSSRAVEGFFVKAQRIRRAITQDFSALFRAPDASQRVDLLLTPTCVGAALSFGQIAHDRQHSPVAAYLNDIFTIPSNLAGIPALSVPSGLDEQGLPLGLQLLGDYHSEGRLIDVAAWIQARVQQDCGAFDPFRHNADLIQELVQQQDEART